MTEETQSAAATPPASLPAETGVPDTAAPVNLEAPPPAWLQLPEYRCHKKVQAAQIEAMGRLADGRTRLALVGGVDVFVDDAFVRRHQPVPGGYYVRYDDGYESWSPARAFEEGYSRSRPAAVPIDALRVLSKHLVPGDRNGLLIEVLDEPGAGGACHLYNLAGFNTGSNRSDPFVQRYGKPAEHATILFQNGPIDAVGPNGLTVEALLAVVIDRLEGFQSGPAACDENRAALLHVTRAMDYLHARTRRRLAAGTEGTAAGA